MRQIVLDTETTGLEPAEGHRIIEIGCLELVDRRMSDKEYHQYINPERNIDAEALAIHGINAEFLAQQVVFKTIIDDFLSFIKNSEVIIHNAPFDVGFLNHELQLAEKSTGKNYGKITDYCSVVDTLAIARQLHPGQRNSLDALCKRYGVNNSHRKLHGALLDAELLAFVYLAMSGGQISLFGEENTTSSHHLQTLTSTLTTPSQQIPLRVIKATAEELSAHTARLTTIEKITGKKNSWDKTQLE